MRPRCLIALAAFAFILSTSCASKDPLQQVLDEIVEAAQDRDVDPIAARLSQDFAGRNGIDRASTIDTARRYLGAYQALDVTIDGYEAAREDDSGRMRFRLTMTGVPRSIGGLGDLVPRRATYDFELELVDEAGTWRIVEADWVEVPDP